MKEMKSVNALSRAISFLQNDAVEQLQKEVVSMPCLGRFHFYKL